MAGPLASDTAMVLAAGLGKRMRPLTASQPKPMIRVAGKPLLDHTLDHLAAAGIVKAVVNVHYLADAIEGHVKDRKLPAVTISDERARLMETGGGIVQAQALLPDPFFCVNSDNIWLDGPRDAFGDLSALWDAERMDALLLLVPHTGARNFAGKGDFHMDGRGRIARRGLAASRRSSSPASNWYRSACCAMRPMGRSPPTCCGTGRSRMGGFTAWSSPANGSRSAPRKRSP